MVDTQTSEQSGTEPQASTRSKLILIVGATVIGFVLVAALAMIGARAIGSGDSWNVEAGQPVEVAIDPGTPAREIYSQLHDAGVARSSELEAAATSLVVTEQLRAGSYAFVTDSDAEAVIRQLVEGPNVESGSTITVIEGWTVDRIVDELSAHTGFSKGEFQKVLRDGLVTSPYLPQDETLDPVVRWEGLLFPAKYPIAQEATPVEILGAMADEFTRRMDVIDWSSLESLGVSRYEAIVVASLIQREAGHDGERSTVASVIYNRLEQDMRLQIDATVIYALGYNPGRVLAKHLEVESLWNTYRNDGLPPTPIGTAGLASLEAAARPASTPYLFYVLASEDGSHAFAETYDGHQQNIADAKEAGVLP